MIYIIGFFVIFGLFLIIGIFDLIGREPIFDILGMNYMIEAVFLIAASTIGIGKGIVELRKVKK